MTYQQQQFGFAWPRLTPAIKLLLIINTAVFVLNMFFQGSLGELMGASRAGIAQGWGLGIVRLVTYQFVHAFVTPWHFLINMLMLYMFGTFVESAIGKTRMLRLYLCAGGLGGVVQLLFGLVVGSPDIPTVGASGSVYGIMVYGAFMAPRMRVLLIVFPIELRWLVGILVGVGVYMMFVEYSRGTSGGVAHGGHVGGALWGFIAFRIRHTRFTWLDKFRGWQQGRDARSAQKSQEVLDDLLDKVSKEGLNSLTPAERRFLDKTSQKMRQK